MSEIKDFSKARKRIRFQIDDDVFEASPAVPAEILMDFAGQFADLDPETASVTDQLKAFRGVLELVLLPESLNRFNERLRDRSAPVDITQVEEIIEWLFEEYGLRPTESPLSLPTGSADPVSGMGSTASTVETVSISALSPSTGS
jgi:hypothetical protein